MNDIIIDQDVEDPVEPDGAFEVNARWLTDLDEFNEWMNEEDYLIEDDSGVRLRDAGHHMLIIVIPYYVVFSL